jgi:hypothetical protein
MIVLSSILIIVLFLIAYQDIKYFKVNLILYIAAFLISLGIFMQSVEFHSFIFYTAVNLIILSLQTGFLILYIILKLKEKKRLFNYFGQGDLLFFLVLSITFAPFNFIVFQIVSFIIILAFHVILKRVGIFGNKVPLAGYQALILILLLFADFFSKSFNRFDDSLITYLF